MNIIKKDRKNLKTKKKSDLKPQQGSHENRKREKYIELTPVKN